MAAGPGLRARRAPCCGRRSTTSRVEAAVDPGPAAARPRSGRRSAPRTSLPRFPQYWAPLAGRHGARGPLTVGDETHDLAGARAYAEKSWGPRFPPDGWWWGAAHAFEDPALAVAFAGGPLLRGVALRARRPIVARIRAGLVRLGTPPFTPGRDPRRRGLVARPRPRAAHAGGHRRARPPARTCCCRTPSPPTARSTAAPSTGSTATSSCWSRAAAAGAGARWPPASSPLAGLERGRPLRPGRYARDAGDGGGWARDGVTMTDDELARYAAAVVRDCLGTQPGDLVAVHGEPAHRPLATRASWTRPTAPAPATSTCSTSTARPSAAASRTPTSTPSSTCRRGTPRACATCWPRTPRSSPSPARASPG